MKYKQELNRLEYYLMHKDKDMDLIITWTDSLDFKI